MPLLVVPLTVQSSFMMITETLSTLVYNMPHGPPDYQTFRLQEQEESEWDLFFVLLVERTKQNIARRVALGKVFRDAFENAFFPEKSWSEIIME